MPCSPNPSWRSLIARLLAVTVLAAIGVIGLLGAVSFGTIILGSVGGLRVTRSDLVGTYKAEYPDGTCVLVLGSDGAFQQRRLGQGVQPPANSGRWRLLKSDGEAMVQLDGTILPDDPFSVLGTKPVKGLVDFDVQCLFGQITLSINEDLDEYYEKVDKPV